MFDFTKEIALGPESQKRYRRWQLVLYLAAFFLAVFLAYLIIFPPKNFSYLFSDPTSNDNNIDNPRWKNDALLFDTNITSDYSTATVKIVLDQTDKNPSLNKIAVRRSYQAFMYDTGASIGFRDGTLVENGQNFYIVSDGALRRFSDQSELESMGYSTSAFENATDEDLKYNPLGEDVAQDSYPNGTLFHISDNYYILEKGTLEKFISDQAYLSLYSSAQAISKDADFLKNFSVSTDLAGFADGSLVSNGGSVYILSSGQFYPIDSALTFVEKGYTWDDVVPVGSDVLAIYKKAKIFNIKVPHPDGTVFKTQESGKYYLVKDSEKHLLPTDAVAASWEKGHPISVDEKSLQITAECSLQKEMFSSRTYKCRIPLDNLSGLIGFNYEFSLGTPTTTKISSLSVNYKKNINKNNLKAFLTNIYYAIKTNYATK